MSTKHAANFKKFGARHYGFNKQEMVVKSGKGMLVADTDGKVFMDLASGYASNGFGHAYPPLHEALIRALAINPYGWGIPGTIPNAIPTTAQTEFLPTICNLLGYEKALPMNTGAEAVETAIKLVRKWGYVSKGVEKDKATIVVCEGNFHGRTTTIVSFSSEGLYKDLFTPATPGFIAIPFGDIQALTRVLSENPNIVGFLLEPIQGEGGVRFPPDGYIQEVRELCTKHNVIMIADEVQTGLGRTGKLLACDHEGVRPDIVLLGKLLGAGKVPVSCVLAHEQFMVFAPGEHGSTYSGGAFGMTVASIALSLLVKEKLCARSECMGNYLLRELRRKLLPRYADVIKEIRGRGLMLAIEPHAHIKSATFIELFLNEGLLAKDAHGVIRLSPALIITKKECDRVVRAISKAFRAYTKKHQ